MLCLTQQPLGPGEPEGECYDSRCDILKGLKRRGSIGNCQCSTQKKGGGGSNARAEPWFCPSPSPGGFPAPETGAPKLRELASSSKTGRFFFHLANAIELVEHVRRCPDRNRTNIYKYVSMARRRKGCQQHVPPTSGGKSNYFPNM